MEHRSIYEQIAGRTDGTVYIGVVGPVRTGKSTFIKRFMEQLVLPNIENVYERERATDELPQSGSGRTIMTAEPKFVPNEAARISPDGKTTLLSRSALNEVAVGRGSYPKCIDLRLNADGCMVRTIRADGVVFATPTGSSAYSMAAGGSVIDPVLECVCVTPVCPISRYACPIIFSGNTTLELENIDDRAPHVDVTADGTEPMPLYFGERLVISRSERRCKMLKLKHAGFFSVLNAKLSEYELKK